MKNTACTVYLRLNERAQLWVGRNGFHSEGQDRRGGCVARLLYLGRGPHPRGPLPGRFCGAASALTGPQDAHPRRRGPARDRLGWPLSGALDVGRDSPAGTNGAAEPCGHEHDTLSAARPPGPGRRPAPSGFPPMVWANRHPATILVLCCQLDAADTACDYSVLADTLFSRCPKPQQRAGAGGSGRGRGCWTHRPDPAPPPGRARGPVHRALPSLGLVLPPTARVHLHVDLLIGNRLYRPYLRLRVCA